MWRELSGTEKGSVLASDKRTQVNSCFEAHTPHLGLVAQQYLLMTLKSLSSVSEVAPGVKELHALTARRKG